MATIRSSNYKYITLRDSITVMYDLKKDMKELVNIQNEFPKMANDMKIDLNKWQQALKSPLWKEPEPWNMVTRRIYMDLMKNESITVKQPSDLGQVGSAKMH
jgi:hypothetical protein